MIFVSDENLIFEFKLKNYPSIAKTSSGNRMLYIVKKSRKKIRGQKHAISEQKHKSFNVEKLDK